MESNLSQKQIQNQRLAWQVHDEWWYHFWKKKQKKFSNLTLVI